MNLFLYFYETLKWVWAIKDVVTHSFWALEVSTDRHAYCTSVSHTWRGKRNKDAALKKSICNLNGNVMSPWWQWISLLIDWSCQGQIGKQTYPLGSCMCSLLRMSPGGSLRTKMTMCLCDYNELGGMMTENSVKFSFFIWGDLVKEYI